MFEVATECHMKIRGTYVGLGTWRERARASDRKDMPVVPDRQEPDVKAKIRPVLQGIRLPTGLCEKRPRLQRDGRRLDESERSIAS